MARNAKRRVPALAKLWLVVEFAELLGAEPKLVGTSFRKLT